MTEPVIDYLLRDPHGQFYLEDGGEIVIDEDGRSLDDQALDLFARLVSVDPAPEPETLRAMSRSILRQAGAPVDDPRAFHENFHVQVDVRGRRFDDEISFAVRNGVWHYMQEVPIDPRHIRITRRTVGHAAFLFEHVLEQNDGKGYVLVDGHRMGLDVGAMLRVFDGLASVIDVTDRHRAVGTLQLALHSSP